jgi:DNA-binding transcriptional regulator YhcF (GntR family)
MSHLFTPRQPSVSERLRNDLARAIADGGLSRGDRLPTSRELGREYGISHVAAARAVDHLVAEGLVTKRRGAGTFVATHGGPTQALRVYEGVAANVSCVGPLLDDWNASAPATRAELVHTPESADIRVMSGGNLDRARHPALLTPLNRYCPHSSELEERFHPFLITPVQQNGTTYAMPLWFAPEVLAFNRDLLGTAAADIGSWSLDDLLTAVRELQPGLSKKGARTCSVVARFRYQMFPLLSAFGGAVTDQSLTRCRLGQPGSVAAVVFAQELARAMPDYPVGVASNIDDLLAGRLAIKTTTSRVFERFAEAPARNLALTPFPAGLQPGGSLTGMWAGITSWCRQPERAWELLDYLSGAEMQQRWADAGRLFPARRAACVSLLDRHHGQLDAIYRSSFLTQSSPSGLSGAELSFIDHEMAGWWNEPDVAGRLAATASLVDARLYRDDDAADLDDISN